EPYEVQQALVAAQSSRVDDPPYAIPNVLEAATVILSHYVRSGEERQRLYSDNPWTYTRCRDLVAWCGNNYSALVGCFSSGGLYVDYRNYPDVSNYRGVAGLRKF
ncbi:MAG: hypothetical protein MUC61_01305, partial [Amoebophilaceae bacterium]|nr:hypothetical protein [Amoebophilaceae bacterium]